MTAMTGADTTALRDVSSRFAAAAATLEDAARRLAALVEPGPWLGPDADAFRADWGASLRPTLAAAARLLAETGERVRGHADEQDAASGGPGGSGAAGAAGAAGRVASGMLLGTPDGGLTPPSPEVAAVWRGLDDAQRVRVLQGLVDEQTSRQGLAPVTVRTSILDGPGNVVGGSMPGSPVVLIDTADLANPDWAVDAAFHEARHVAQYEIVADAAAHPLSWWDRFLVGTGLAADPWGHPGENRLVAEQWRANQADYRSPATAGWEAYVAQPVEVDARAAAAVAVEGVTPEQVERLARG